ncbi:hypothetical protein JOQ06_025205, partial [Pogonophryne albipinna]
RFIFNRAGSQTEQRWYLRLRRRPTDARVKCLSVCIRLSLYHDPFKRIYAQQIKGIHNDVPLFYRDGTVVETAPPPLLSFLSPPPPPPHYRGGAISPSSPNILNLKPSEPSFSSSCHFFLPFNQSATIRADRATGNNRGGVTGGVTSEGWGVGIEGRPRQKTATPVQCPAWLFVAVGHVCDCVTLGFLIDRG